MKNIIYVLGLFCIISCNETKEDTIVENKDKPSMSIVRKYATAKKISPIYQEETKDWAELKAVDEFLGRFQNVSAKEILSNSIELEGLVASLKKESKPEMFNIPSFKARLNILHNETLRLVDMRDIPAITANEVDVQTKKIINSFSAVNDKINTILSKKRFEDAIDIDVKYIGLDSTKIDSVSKKSINENLQRKLEEKTKNQ
ncbi:hypothetical protein [Polaribacter sp. MED152]|uniref:hypothetical protein n=1 Tax=Polaribacter sp. MED152 TaxID=313598 RepID=UPI000068CCAD|nr:hypothetical protein [Polaribacter sp. MED152]EAQ42758.1 hypothetical protein MED152_08550 [Polaribacter sp. MED152]